MKSEIKINGGKMAKPRKASQNFGRGGCYTCEGCGKKTRSTGRGDNENVNLCEKCYDEFEEENRRSDSGEEA